MIVHLLLVAFAVVAKLGYSLICPAGFTQNGNLCYDFRNAASLFTWDNCNSYCLAESATMLCIQNSAQQTYTWSQVAYSLVWIGYYKTPATNNFQWVSGCTSTYSALGSGEGYNVNEQVAAMYLPISGQWIDTIRNNAAACYCQANAVEAPTAQPSHQPSIQPTSQPSSQPSMQPTVNLQHRQSILSSPTIQPRNEFAFAALTSTGRVETWGEAQYGGNSTTVRSLLSANVTAIAHARFSFVALNKNGTIAPWGNPLDARGNSGFSNIGYVVANEAAYALVQSTTGAVRALGSPHHGGDIADTTRCPGCATTLASGVRAVVASRGAFVAIKIDGSAFVWGNEHCGGEASTQLLTSLQSVVMVAATATAFAALLHSGRVVTWGDPYMGGDSSAVDIQLREVWHISSSRSTFVAYKKDGELAVWGYHGHADTTSVQAQLTSGVIYVAHTFVASAALKADGTVVTWGRADGGGDSSTVQAQLHDIVKVYGNGKAFAALTMTGGVVAWGKSGDGGQIPADKVIALSSGVVSLYHTDRAFASLKSDGSVVVWGQTAHGGSPGSAVEALLTSGVHTVCANDAAFSAIKTDGSVVAWGHSVSVPTAGVQFTSPHLTAPVECR
jgi:hypothetical protein